MNRSDARALAKTTLEGLALFRQVYSYEPRSFGGYSPVATIHAKSLDLVEDARGLTSAGGEIWVTLYLARPEGQEAAVEDRMDDLARAAAFALAAAFSPHVAQVQIGPSQSGYPTRPLDNQTYRMERFAVRFDDDTED